MDSVKRAIWGGNQNEEEPVSGERGDTSKGEPYDAGNLDEEQKDADANGASARQDSDVKGSSMNPGDSTASQNDVRSPSDPLADPSAAEAKENVDDRGDGPNPTSIEGPGPKPIADLAAEHGGDAGDAGSGGGPTTSGADGGDEDEDGPQKKSQGEGTGEKYVKSTGLQADGGDFDASRPGAGREADRLLEEKGLHNPTDPSSKPSDPDQNVPTEKPKKSLGEKIKDKIHRTNVS